MMIWCFLCITDSTGKRGFEAFYRPGWVARVGFLVAAYELRNRSSVYVCGTYMGWGWAMYMAQRVHSHLVLKCSELPLGNMLEDHVSPPPVGDVPVI
eukprot:4403368-Amphidinium_carterae.5